MEERLRKQLEFALEIDKEKKKRGNKKNGFNSEKNSAEEAKRLA